VLGSTRLDAYDLASGAANQKDVKKLENILNDYSETRFPRKSEQGPRVDEDPMRSRTGCYRSML
jgi:hypothetical protein